jgi:hypothetical protein
MFDNVLQIHQTSKILVFVFGISNTSRLDKPTLKQVMHRQFVHCSLLLFDGHALASLI